MSYQTVDQLARDPAFQGRITAVTTEQANTFKNDARPNYVLLAEDVLKGSAGPLQAFIRMAAVGPGVGDKVDVGDGTIDQSQVTDGDLLSLTQGNWPTVVDLFFPTEAAP